MANYYCQVNIHVDMRLLLEMISRANISAAL